MRNHIEVWLTGRISFHELLVGTPGLTRAALAEDLGIALPKHVISLRHAEDTEWPEYDWLRISLAQTNYDEGVSEMCQGRHGNHFVLYEIPRKLRAKKRNYFSMKDA